MGDEEPTGINLEIFEKKLRTFPLKAKAMPILQVGAFTGKQCSLAYLESLYEAVTCSVELRAQLIHSRFPSP